MPQQFSRCSIGVVSNHMMPYNMLLLLKRSEEVREVRTYMGIVSLHMASRTLCQGMGL